MEGLPALVVPEDPERGEIERVATSPAIQIEAPRFMTVGIGPGRLNAFETLSATPRAAIDDQGLEVMECMPAASRVMTAREADGAADGATVPLEGTSELIATCGVVHDNEASDGRAELTRSHATSTRVASLSSKDYKAMAKRAAASAKLDRLAAGTKSVVDATMTDIASLGIGLELYFLMLQYFSWAFLSMGLVALPVIVVNYYGHGVTPKMVDPLQLAYASLGNQGVNPDVASDPTQCLPLGTIDCTGTHVDTPFTSDPATVAWIVTASDAIYSLVFLLVYLLFRRRARRAIDAHQNEHLTPAKYAIYVRGLPPDATAHEVLEHFNRYDPTRDEMTYPLWLNCCWGRRPRRVKHSVAKKARNCHVVRDLEHLWRPPDVRPTSAGPPLRNETGQSMDGYGSTLKGTTQDAHDMYLGTWIAEVSIAHPTGGLLRTFLAMEVLTRKIAEAQALVTILKTEKEQAEVVRSKWVPPPGKKKAKRPKSTFQKADEVLLQVTTTKLAHLQAAMAKKTSKLKALKHADQHDVKTTKEIATKALDLTACECAFVVFNNLESRRRCLQDYRRSTHWFYRTFQPKGLRFRSGQYPLVVRAAPEPSNILWENLEVTPQSRRLRRTVTTAVTGLLLLLSGVIISAAQSAQQTFKDKAPPAGLCQATLPELFYASPEFLEVKGVTWDLEWTPNATCARGDAGDVRYHVAYANGIVNNITVHNPSKSIQELHRCTDPCVSEKSSTQCNTLACFNDAVRTATGQACETYLASHVLYCLCTAQVQTSIAVYGVFRGPQTLWQTFLPCRGFLTDYIAKNVFIVLASAVVVLVNLVLKATLRGFASFERHTSESAKASAVALKMFAAQFLNTAIIVLVVNAALGVGTIPVVSNVFRGKYTDFQRDWYPTVGMGITMTMLINAIVPQTLLLLQLGLVSPLKRWLVRRSVRTQERMDVLYAGPHFDLAVRYPTVLNSVFVTLVFCGGSPVLLFIATLACGATYWIDKLSLLKLYSVKTAYDEALGETVLGLLPWALVAHLAFSCWMYGNTDLLQAPTVHFGWVFRLFGLSADGSTTTEDMYNELMAQAATFDPLGQHGFVVKVLHVNVMLMFVLFVLVLVGLLFSAVWARVLLPVLRNTIGRIVRALWRGVCLCCSCCRQRKVVQPMSASSFVDTSRGRSAKVAVDAVPTDVATAIAVSPYAGNDVDRHDAELLVPKAVAAATLPSRDTILPIASRSKASGIVLPEFTNVFRKSVAPTFRPDIKLGFTRDPERPAELVRHWQAEAVSNGYPRNPGDLMRTWEAIQAPVKTYAIEANAKYRLAVAELVAASRRALPAADPSECANNV